MSRWGAGGRPRARGAAVAAALLLAAALGACTGTFTPTAPTLYLVVLDEGAAGPARVALLAFEATPTERRLELLNADAFTFAAGERPIALDVLDREGRDEAWLLTAVGGADSRAVRLHRLDLRNVPDVAGATLTAAAAPLDLTDASGAWLGVTSTSAVPTGCLSHLVVEASGGALALWDAGGGGRCGTLPDANPRVHVLDLVGGAVRASVGDAVAPGVRAGDPDDAGALLLVRRPPVGDPNAPEVIAVRYAAPVPGLGAPGVAIEWLRDVVALPGGFAALRGAADGNARSLETRIGETPRQRGAPNGATHLHADATGRLENLLTTGGGRTGVTYPGQEATREINFDAIDVTVEPLNAYALAVRGAGGLCLIDLLVASAATGCDLAIPGALVAALPAPRLITWAYAAPSEP